jgi:hypothetical protein
VFLAVIYSLQNRPRSIIFVYYVWIRTCLPSIEWRRSERCCINYRHALWWESATIHYDVLKWVHKKSIKKEAKVRQFSCFFMFGLKVKVISWQLCARVRRQTDTCMPGHWLSRWAFTHVCITLTWLRRILRPTGLHFFDITSILKRNEDLFMDTTTTRCKFPLSGARKWHFSRSRSLGRACRILRPLSPPLSWS